MPKKCNHDPDEEVIYCFLDEDGDIVVRVACKHCSASAYIVTIKPEELNWETP